MKVLIFSHHHAELVNGGAQRAAYTLFQKINATCEHEAVLVAQTGPGQIGHDGTIGSYRGREREILWAPPGADHFTQMSHNLEQLRRDLRAIVSHVAPDVVHFHHYCGFGLDAFKVIKQEFGLPIALTLHEYMLICNHNGQMVKTGSMQLCKHSSYSECHACFPELSSGKFFLRQQMMQQHLQFVDQIISPSQFLIDRYVAWGLPASKMTLIENLLPDFDALAAAADERSTAGDSEGGRVRIGYFGQINPYKGAPVLLDAIEALPKKLRKRLEVIIFGDNLDIQKEDFRERVELQLRRLGPSITLFGAYNNEDVVALMRTVDWCIIPSIWWENSPLVIQEAKIAGVPILGSNIGGMKEKITHGVNGIHFLAGSALDLAQKIRGIIEGVIVLNVAPSDPAAANQEMLDRHLAIYTAAASEGNV